MPVNWMIQWIERVRRRRHDKLRLWAALIVGVAVPIVLCWGIPNLLADQRSRQADLAASATASAIAALRAANPGLFALCEQPVPGSPSALEPAALQVLVLQNGAVSDLQTALPPGWQPAADGQGVTVVVCLEREVSRPVDACADGSAPDLSQFQLEAGGPGNINRPQEEVVLTRYQTGVAVYEADSGGLIAAGVLFGSDPSICSDPAGSLAGDRLTGQALVAWLTDVLE